MNNNTKSKYIQACRNNAKGIKQTKFGDKIFNFVGQPRLRKRGKVHAYSYT